MDKIVCIGKNYSDHIVELKDRLPHVPVIFLKPPSVMVSVPHAGLTTVPLPADRGEVHHECEIVFRLRSGGYRLAVDAAVVCLGEVTIGLDMTLRSLQSQLKKNGQPWTTSKVFPGSAIIGPWASSVPLLSENFRLAIDGVVRQEGNASQMLMTPAECVAYASQFFPLCTGDLIFTGTPAGVGPVVAGSTSQVTWGDLNYRVTWTE